MDKSAYKIYQLKVTLKHTKPPIWRRILVPSQISLGDLHEILQVTMGWEGGHMHEFKIKGVIYSKFIPEAASIFTSEEDEDLFTLEEVGLRKGQRFVYTYDFGDDWQHTIEVEKILTQDTPLEYPVCLKGQRACPPEDIGGVWGYQRFLEAIKDPSHPLHEDYLERFGITEFDPEEFDIDQVNRALQQLHSLWLSTPDLKPFLDFPETILDYWPNALDDDVQEYLRNVPARLNVVEMLNYFQSQPVLREKDSNLPLSLVRDFARKFLLRHNEMTDEVQEALESLQTQEQAFSVNFCDLLITSGELVSGGAEEKVELTSLGKNFLNAPPAAQVWYLFLTWWIIADQSLVAIDPSYEPLLQGVNETATRVLLERLAKSNPKKDISFSYLVEPIEKEGELLIDSPEQASLFKFGLGLTIYHIVLLPLLHFGVIERLPNPKTGEVTFEIPDFRLNAASISLLEAYITYFDTVYDVYDEDEYSEDDLAEDDFSK